MNELPSFSLAGKVVLQFGGSGLLGTALIASLRSAGAALAICTRNRRSVEDGLAAEDGRSASVSVCECDITSEKSLTALRDQVLERYKRVDGVVFNSVVRPMRKMSDTLEMWQESMRVNATGFFATARMFGDAMAAGKRGSIVNIASIQGMMGSNFWLYEGTGMTSPPDYSFHKSGMIGLTRYLASHYGPHGVRVNAISPGGIYDAEKPQDAGFVERYGKMTMLGRMARVVEICGPVVFLISDASQYITGANIPVDGGYSAK